jgi:hypothetical protein
MAANCLEVQLQSVGYSGDRATSLQPKEGDTTLHLAAGSRTVTKKKHQVGRGKCELEPRPSTLATHMLVRQAATAERETGNVPSAKPKQEKRLTHFFLMGLAQYVYTRVSFLCLWPDANRIDAHLSQFAFAMSEVGNPRLAAPSPRPPFTPASTSTFSLTKSWRTSASDGWRRSVERFFKRSRPTKGSTSKVSGAQPVIPTAAASSSPGLRPDATVRPSSQRGLVPSLVAHDAR